VEEIVQTMDRYCLGFCFNTLLSRVILIKKTHPPSQAHRLNGLGGRIQDGEASDVAMTREFFEEAGFEIPLRRWQHFVTIKGQSAPNRYYEIVCFIAFNNEVFDFVKTNPRPRGQEQVKPYLCDQLHRYYLVIHCSWLIAMARAAKKSPDITFAVTEFKKNRFHF